MLIIIDNKIPDQAKENLSKFGELLHLSTSGITYPSISGHPDIFFCKTSSDLIISPNLPNSYKEKLKTNGISFREGKKKVTQDYPHCAAYNAVIDDEYIIHKFDITEEEILKSCSLLKKIPVKQGFCRCNVIPLGNNSYVVSDEGILKLMKDKGLTVTYVNPEKIILPGHKYGFFGGTCGIYENKFFILGSLKYHSHEKEIIEATSNAGLEIIELYNGPLFDGGSILFL